MASSTPQRRVVVAFAAGDVEDKTAQVRILKAGTLVATAQLSGRHPRQECTWPGDASGPYTFEVEYAWGYGREASYRGSSEEAELILPFPGSKGPASFSFPRRLA